MRTLRESAFDLIFIALAFISFASAVGCLGTRPNFSASGSSSSQPSAPNNAAAPSLFVVNAPEAGSRGTLASVSYLTGTGVTVPLFSIFVNSNSTPLVCSSVMWNENGTLLLVKFNHDQISVQVQIKQAANSLDLLVDSGSKVISAISQSEWDPSLQIQPIAVPYYTSQIYYSQRLSVFLNSWWDWHTTHATSFQGMQQLYYPKTDGTLNPLSEHLHVLFNSNVDMVFPSTGNQLSPYISSLAGRTILDIWDAGFADIQSGLEALQDYGISHCAAIIHDWQYQGYDNGFPQHYPANPQLGGNDKLVSMMRSAPNDCLMALHENYIDYYPDYPKFNPGAIALNSDGSQMLSYYNAALGIQSYSVRHDQMVLNAGLQAPYIHTLYGTTAGYLDGHSAAALNTHGDMNSSAPGAGMMADWMISYRDLFAYERSAHNGPVFGEGLDHWYYIGLLDGVEAQLGAGEVPQNSDVSLPLFVDFDLFMVHPLQVNHGMGYYDRWTSTKTNVMSSLQQDAYRMQEIAFGHAPFLGSGAWDSVPRALTESALVGPVAAEYGSSTVSSIQYLVNGSWINPSQAAIQGAFNVPRITYLNGLTITANSSTTPVIWNGTTIPQYGWAASSSDILAYSAYCKDTEIWCDYAETSTSVFANARNQADLNSASGFATPSIIDFAYETGRQFQITIHWTDLVPFASSENYRIFIHFVNDSLIAPGNDGIVFQAGYYPDLPVSQWKPQQTILDGPHIVTVPANVPDGVYSVRIMVVNAATGTRLLLSGNNDGTNRSILGYLNISGGCSRIGLQLPPSPSADPRLNAAGEILNFGSIRTDGMVLMEEKQGRWQLRPFPRTRAFTVLLNSAKFPMPAMVLPDTDTLPPIVPIAEPDGYWRLPLIGAKSYSWPVQ